MLYNIVTTLKKNSVAEYDLDKLRLAVLGSALSIAARSNTKWGVGSIRMWKILSDAYQEDCLTVYSDIYGRTSAYVLDVLNGSRVIGELGPLLMTREEDGPRFVVDVCTTQADPALAALKWIAERKPDFIECRSIRRQGRLRRIRVSRLTNILLTNVEQRYGRTSFPSEQMHIFDVSHLRESSQRLGLIFELAHSARPDGWPCVVKAHSAIGELLDSGNIVLDQTPRGQGVVGWRLVDIDSLAFDVNEFAGRSDGRVIEGKNLLFFLLGGDQVIVGQLVKGVMQRHNVSRAFMPAVYYDRFWPNGCKTLSRLPNDGPGDMICFAVEHR